MKAKIQFLESYGWIVGERNPLIMTDFSGGYMCCEPYEDDELPTKDGVNGPWCLVGDDLEVLIEGAYEFLTDFIDPALNPLASKGGLPLE